MGGGRSKLPPVPADKRIVIVGGGYGGTELGLQLLKDKANFTLLDSRDAMHHNMAAVRAAVLPGYAKKTMIPYKPTFGDHFKCGRVTDILTNNKKVMLASGEELPYDVLVIATGTTGPFPCKLEDTNSTQNAISMYGNIVDKIKQSPTVSVVGGGAAGVELAAEIKSEYPNKEVTLLHSHNELLSYPSVTKDFSDKVKEIMDRMKITMILGARVSNLSQLKNEQSGVVETEKGESIKSDLVLKCTGLHINSGAYSNSLKEAVEPSGALKVNSFLEVEGHSDVYAIGDCNNVPENKLAHNAEKQGKVVADNIRAKYSNQALTPYVPGSGAGKIAMMISLGQQSGLAQFTSGSILWEAIASKMKAKSMMTPMMWKRFSQQEPSDK